MNWIVLSHLHVQIRKIDKYFAAFQLNFTNMSHSSLFHPTLDDENRKQHQLVLEILVPAAARFKHNYRLIASY